MAQNKNQHFVPKCYLKSFSIECKGKAINVLNHSHNQIKIIQGASVAGQCSKSYFYGNNLELEKIFQVFEQEYALIITKIINKTQDITSKELWHIRVFAFLQMLRTDMSIQKCATLANKLHNAVYKGFEKYQQTLDTSQNNMVRIVIDCFRKNFRQLEGLEVLIIENKTKYDFVTSDDPVILTNRLNIQRLQQNLFGIATSGTQLMMPLSPKFYLMCYDNDVYTVSNKKGYKAFIQKKSDIDALNEFQFLKSQNNIYFQNINHQIEIQKNFLFFQSKRIDINSSVNIFVGVPHTRHHNYQSYRKANSTEYSSSKERFLAHRNINIEPSKWCSILRYRIKMYGYTVGLSGRYKRKNALDKLECYQYRKEIILPKLKICQ